VCGAVTRYVARGVVWCGVANLIAGPMRHSGSRVVSRLNSGPACDAFWPETHVMA
jgi:hypothetical protein